MSENDQIDKDIFLYNGLIFRGEDKKFIEKVENEKEYDNCLIIMISPGGDADAAYKMARYLQIKYGNYTVMICGLCKSAATLFAVGANDLIFTSYGELGPLDVQITREDKLTPESGLNLTEALGILESDAIEKFHDLVIEIISKSAGLISFKTASDVAVKMISGLFSPIFAQIDPDELGARARDLKIGVEYAKRLNTGNLDSNSLTNLISEYPSHSFVIDYTEAQSLFKNVRLATEVEYEMISDISSELEIRSNGALIKKISTEKLIINAEVTNDIQKQE